MAERDAFGNEIGGTPDPLSTDFGADAPRRRRARRAQRGPRMPGAPDPVALARRAGGVVRALVIGWVLLSLALVLLFVAVFSDRSDVSRPGDALRRSISSGVARITVPKAPEAPARPRTPPTGFARGSLLLRANFARALAILRPEGSRLRTLRVAPDRIDASIVTAKGAMKQVQVTWEGRLQVFSTSGPGFPLTGTFAIDQLARAAPFRLSASAAERAGRTPAGVDYLVAIQLGAAQGWTVVLKDGGGQYIADHGGRITRRIS